MTAKKNVDWKYGDLWSQKLKGKKDVLPCLIEVIVGIFEYFSS